jgi:indolepyruvate decarboxylase
MAISNKVTVGDYLIERIQAAGARHVFGVPGDFIISWMSRVEKSSLQLITTSDEQGAGFAADSYARLKGLGVVAVTYGAGGLKLANSTAQAYAEESPVIIISGAPGIRERHLHALIHHMVKSYDSQLNVFKELTCAQTSIDDPNTACSEIDRVINHALESKRPVYIELPRDMESIEVERPNFSSAPSLVPLLQSNVEALDEAFNEVLAILNQAKRPVVMLGIQATRFGLVDQVLQFIERHNIAVATTILSKSAINEMHPNFIGVYAGHMSREEVFKYVENSDGLLMLGVLMTDINMGVYTAQLDPSKIIHVTRDRIAIGRHVYENISAPIFIERLSKSNLVGTKEKHYAPLLNYSPPSLGGDSEKITVETLFARLGQFITEECVVVADPGDALFAAIDLKMHHSSHFLASAFYASLGFAIPGSIGVGFADPSLRPIVVVGDGAFQMTGMELSVAVRYGLDPIVIVLNNDGYLTERLILEGQYNDLTPWKYHKITEVLGAGYGAVILSNGDFMREMSAAVQRRGSFTLLEVKLDRMDCSPALKRLGAAINQQVEKK